MGPILNRHPIYLLASAVMAGAAAQVVAQADDARRDTDIVVTGQLIASGVTDHIALAVVAAPVLLAVIAYLAARLRSAR